MKTKVQTCGGFDGDFYNITICFTDSHCINLDGLSKEDMLELQSCINCMLIEDELDGSGISS
jgi:hypothetical protein